MGFISRFKEGVTKATKAVERGTGIDLPGGYTKAEVKGKYEVAPAEYVAPKPTPPKPTPPKPTPPKPTPPKSEKEKRTFRERAADAVKTTYKAADVAVGGLLPGGVTPTEARAIQKQVGIPITPITPVGIPVAAVIADISSVKTSPITDKVVETAKTVVKKAYTAADVAVGGYLPGAVETKEQKYRSTVEKAELSKLQAERASIIQETKQQGAQYELPDTGEVVSGTEYRKIIEQDPYYSKEGMAATAAYAARQPTETVTIEGIPTELKTYEPVSDVGYIPQARTYIGRVFERANVGLSERVTKPVYRGVGRVTGLEVEEVGDIPGKVFGLGYEYTPAGQITKYTAPETFEKVKGAFTDVPESFIEAGLTKIRDKPVTTLGEVALWTSVGPILGVAGKVGGAAAKVTRVSKIPGYATGVRRVGIGVGVGLGAAYTGAVGLQVAGAPEGERATEFGKILAEDVSPMLAGGLLGASLVKGAQARTIRKAYTERPIEEFVIPEVLSGKKTFPESPAYGYKGKVSKLTPEDIVAKQQFDVGVFRQRQKAYHATGERFWKKGEVAKIQKGKSEFEGLYAAPSVSTYFLRTGKGYKLYGTPKKPGILEITPEAFGTREVIRTGLKGKAGIKRFKGELKPGEAYVTGVKPEIEAVIPYSTGTGLKVSKGKYYFEYKGQPIPIDVAKTVGGKTKIIGVEGGASTYNPLISSSYGGLGAYPIITPLAAGIGAAKISSYKKLSPTSYSPTPLATSYKPTPVTTTYKPVAVTKPKKITSTFYPVVAPTYEPTEDYLSSKPTVVAPSYKPAPLVAEPSYEPISPIKPSEPSYKTIPYTPEPIYEPTPYIPEPIYTPSYAAPTSVYKPTDIVVSRGILKPNDFKKKKKVVKKKVIKKGQAYNSYGKTQKTKKWKKLNKVPLTNVRAKDYGSYMSDGTLSASYKIKPTKGVPQKGRLSIPTGYAAKTKDKFREYKISKGKKVPTPNSFIEKRNLRLDSRGETSGITLYKKLSELKKKSLVNPKIKKKAIKRSKVFGL